MQIVFFVNIIRQARCIRRIQDFINRGYNTKIFGFDRHGDNRSIPLFPHEIIGQIHSTSSYFQRMRMMCSAINSVLKSQDRNAVFYIFSLDVAIAYILAGGLKYKYIYEVSDLMELEVNNKILSRVLVSINRFIIKHSIETIMTSLGFAKYYFGENIPSYIYILPNKLDRSVLSLPRPEARVFNSQNISIGFTGAIRNKSIYQFINVVGNYFPNIRLHFYGIFTDDKVYGEKIRNSIEKFDNVEYLGPFNNPQDFPEIYSHIDLVLCLYTDKGNDRVLEPNKLYEALFYEKPIIVSKSTFTGDYVDRCGIGYTVCGENPDDIISLLKSITDEDYYEKVYRCSLIPKEESVDNTDDFFIKLVQTLHCYE